MSKPTLKLRGFTLIELLIVIAVIGILATAVLSAINPVEQIKKANDSRRRSNAAELLNALERYYASYSVYPSAFSMGDAAIGTQTDTTSLTTLGSELKPQFVTRVTESTDNYLYVYKGATDDLVHVCFQIESAQQIAKYSTVLTTSGNNKYTCLPE